MLTRERTVVLRTGRRMPMLGLGTWQLTQDTAGTIEKAFALGYEMIDTSGDYGTQWGIGQALKKSGKARDDYFIVTKVEEDDDAYEAAEKNIHELGLAHADLILIHRPPHSGAGEELWQGLMRAKKDGCTVDIGVSNYSIELMNALMAAGEVPAVNQIEWSPFGYSKDMLEYCASHGIVIQAYSPLTRTNRLHDAALERIAHTYGKTPAQLLLRWNVQTSSVPLPKANREEHLKENMDIFDFEIRPDDMATLNAFNERYSSLGSLAYS